MTQRFKNVIQQDDGMSTAEYAVGTVAAAGFGGLLITLLKSNETRELIWNVIQHAFEWIL